MSDLIDFYNNLKTTVKDDSNSQTTKLFNVNKPGVNVPQGLCHWKKAVNDSCNNLKNECGKRILLDIYCKILPLDDNYKQGHRREMINDIDSFLKSKNIGARDYLQQAQQITS